ncbi:MAG: hypothetical protein RIQ93_3321 [Verrucomicrobiota bacterium]|jgi:phosphate transport system substrate-binding protein
MAPSLALRGGAHGRADASLMRGPCFQFALLLLALLRSFSPLVAKEHRIVGTDLLGVGFSKALYDFAGRNGFSLALALDGSRPGLDEMKAGRADMALLVLPPGEAASVASFHTVTLAYHRVVVLVSADCSLRSVTYEELTGIFGSSGAAHVAKWGDLGLKAEWAGSPIAAIAPAVGTGITAELFSHLVLRGRNLKSNVIRYPDPASLIIGFANNAHAIALASDVPSNAPGLKAIAVAADRSAPASLPTADNLHSGDYGLRLPVRLLVRQEALPQLVALVRFLCGEEGSAHLERAGVVPLPWFVRGQQLLALEKW